MSLKHEIALVLLSLLALANLYVLVSELGKYQERKPLDESFDENDKRFD